MSKKEIIWLFSLNEFRDDADLNKAVHCIKSGTINSNYSEEFLRDMNTTRQEVVNNRNEQANKGVDKDGKEPGTDVANLGESDFRITNFEVKDLDLE